MEELTKTQIVLLTLLVSFVTSIATGIVTVALVDQSSQGVGHTIQTVVQRTIETVIPTVAPNEVEKIVSNAIATKDDDSPQVTPSESELMVQAVAKNSASLVRIKKVNAKPGEAFVALGVIVSPTGVIATDQGLLIAKGKYTAVLADGKEVALTPKKASASGASVAIFTFIPPIGVSIGAATLGDSTKLNLGQRVISLSGSDRDTVDIGIISSFDKTGTSTNKAYINTDFDVTNKPYGSILLNLAGEIIGIKTGNSATAGFSYRAINFLKEEIKQGIITPN